MPIPFPSDEWIQTLQARLNASLQYAHIARNWEGDLLIQIDWPNGRAPTVLYLDLWHGQCREASLVPADQVNQYRPAFRLSAPVGHFVRILQGDLDPMQAMITGKLRVQGNMVMMMKNIPTVLEFVRHCQLIDSEFPQV